MSKLTEEMEKSIEKVVAMNHKISILTAIRDLEVHVCCLKLGMEKAEFYYQVETMED